MPDVGRPPSPVPNTPITNSHTGTQQWQSFEVRMRRRRAERCRLRAQVAIEAGRLDEAQEALDEARRLQPDLPGLLIADDRLADARISGVEPAVAKRRGGARAFAAAAALALTIGAATWLMSGGPDAPPQSVTTAATIVAPAVTTDSKPASGDPPEPAVIQPAAFAPYATTSPRAPTEPPVSRGPLADQPARDQAEPLPDPRPSSPQPIVTAAPLIVVPPPEPRPASPPVATPTAESTVPMPPPATSLPTTAPPPAVGTSRTAAPDSLPHPEPAAPAAEPAAEVKVRAALARYEAAYSALNAAAARAIWPTVSAEALDRAFDGLESQRISLGDCTISVGSNGQSARAACAGNATWTPKIGDGTRTEARRWLFDLELAGDRWQIVRATTR